MGYQNWQISAKVLTQVKPVDFIISPADEDGMWVDCPDALCCWQEYAEGLSIETVLKIVITHTNEHNDLVFYHSPDLQESLRQMRAGEVAG